MLHTPRAAVQHGTINWHGERAGQPAGLETSRLGRHHVIHARRRRYRSARLIWHLLSPCATRPYFDASWPGKGPLVSCRLRSIAVDVGGVPRC
jgi:hypothetical protein